MLYTFLLLALILMIITTWFLSRKNKSLQLRVKRAENLSEVKSLFLANMSHEIRTPLGSIMGFAKLLDRKGLAESDRLHYVEIIKKAGQNLSDLINDILDISKIESGHLTFEKTDVSLWQLLIELQDIFSLKCRQKNINLTFKLAPEVPEFIHTDALRLKQILLNVLGNAIKFTNHGGVELRASCLNGQLVFDVIDTGIGIPPDSREMIFEPFKQGDPTHPRAFGGTGLGVPLSRRLAELLGGHLELVSSRVNHGSHFQIAVALESVKSFPAAAKVTPSLTETVNLSGMKVLAVDDSEDNRSLLKVVLEDWGCEVDLASDGHEALEKVSSQNFDGILMDLQMPLMGGMEAVRIMREKGLKTPVFALTARAMIEDAEECARAGFTDFLSKPIQFERLFHKISQCRKAD